MANLVQFFGSVTSSNSSSASLAVDADADTISGLTGKLGKIRGVSVKAAISKK